MLYFALLLWKFSLALVRIGIIAFTGPLTFCPFRAADHISERIAKMQVIKDKAEIMITADAERNKSLGIIMSGRRHAWKEWNRLH